MKQKSGPDKAPAEQALKNIRRQTRRQYSAEEKIRIVLEGLRGEESISELCRRVGIAASMYYGWSKEFLEAGIVAYDTRALRHMAVNADEIGVIPGHGLQALRASHCAPVSACSARRRMASCAAPGGRTFASSRSRVACWIRRSSRDCFCLKWCSCCIAAPSSFESSGSATASQSPIKAVAHRTAPAPGGALLGLHCGSCRDGAIATINNISESRLFLMPPGKSLTHLGWCSACRRWVRGN